MKHFFSAISLYPYILIPFFCSCSSTDPSVHLEGNAQGTTFHITYLDEQQRIFNREIDSILVRINESMSTYDPSSVISRINKNDSTVLTDSFFEEVFNKSIEISDRTGGAFDVTIAPLVNAWGFGPDGEQNADSTRIDSLRQLVNYKAVKIENHKLIKNDSGVKLDFNAIAQGYTVDVLCLFLEKNGIINYFVELGGEVRVKGSPDVKSKWRVGIDQPADQQKTGRPLQAIIELKDKALATSGNYRKFYVKDGIKYSHTIDPATGYPVRHSLLSATVVANDCMTADAFATAFMVMGAEKAIEYLKLNTTLQAYFIYSDENGKWITYATNGLILSPLKQQDSQL